MQSLRLGSFLLQTCKKSAVKTKSQKLQICKIEKKYYKYLRKSIADAHDINKVRRINLYPNIVLNIDKISVILMEVYVHLQVDMRLELEYIRTRKVQVGFALNENCRPLIS